MIQRLTSFGASVNRLVGGGAENAEWQGEPTET